MTYPFFMYLAFESFIYFLFKLTPSKYDLNDFEQVNSCKDEMKRRDDLKEF